MINQTRHPYSFKVCFSGIILSAIVLALAYESKSDDAPAFFLKIAKNVPRMGRSNKFDDFYLSSTKNKPIGDSNKEGVEPWQLYESAEPHAKPIKRRLNYPSYIPPNTWSGQHYPLAIEGPRELWRELAQYSTDTADEIENGIWERQKRTGNAQQYP